MRSLGYNVCVLVRWAILTVSLSTLLFLAVRVRLRFLHSGPIWPPCPPCFW